MDILIIDDHPLFRSSLLATLSYHFTDASFHEESSFEDSQSYFEGSCPDLVLLDLNLPQTDGLSALKSMLNQHCDAVVIMLSGSEDLVDMKQCLDAGAKGYLIKTETPECIVQAIHSVLEGNVHTPKQLQEIPADIERRMKVAEQLTERQIKVLSLLQQGSSNKEIANELELSVATVKVHCRDIFRILGVNNRSKAVIEATEMGLI